MALPASIAANIKNGGIRQGKVYLVSSGTEGDGTNPGDFTVMGLGVTKNLVVSTSDNESDQDSQGRTWAISTSVNATATLMQHSAAEIEAVQSLKAPADGTPEEGGYNVLFTDRSLNEAEVLDLLNTVAGRVVPGILLEGVFPKVEMTINHGVEDSEIVVSFNGVVKPDAFVGFEANPVLTFAS